MKLKGTLTEESYRTDLRRSHNYIFSSSQGKFLYQALINMIPELKTAYILSWTPDDGADYFSVMINGDLIVYLEIEEDTVQKFFKPLTKKRVVSFGSCSINEYKKGLSKTNQIKLEVAIDLCNKDLKVERSTN